MLRRASSRPLCSACSKQLLDVFVGGFASAPTRLSSRLQASASTSKRNFHKNPIWHQLDRSTNKEQDLRDDHATSLQEEQEAKVRLARQQYGENLPLDHLTVDEYRIYERLYGPPLRFIEPEHENFVELSEPTDELVETEDAEQHALLREKPDGSLEEIEYTHELAANQPLENGEHEETEEFEADETPDDEFAHFRAGHEAEDSTMLYDLERARFLVRQEQEERERSSEGGQYTWQESEIDEGDQDNDYVRTHALTSAGRFATFPRTLSMPAAEFAEPVQSRLAEKAKYRHLIEGAEKLFGGKLLPDSNATPPKHGRSFQQKPIPLSADKFRMTQLDANVFLSTIMPGAYATTMSILVEVRKRLGSSWLEGLLRKPGGPSVLDVGGGGAGILAWRKVLNAEWDRMHEESGRVAKSHPKLGKSTVLAGSRELQAAVSHLMEDTSFIPRLPDFNRLTDMSPAKEGEEPTRKQYDVIFAPYAIWQIEEDYMKKSLVQNLWSLLDPNGGVLIIAEKGLPRGFEAVAGAREVLLQHHIKNSQVDVQEQMEAAEHKHTQMEDGMIIAPCTNHTTCPMYKIPGEMAGRKDLCSFQQRFERPPFLQRILGAKHHNYEDINFSYVAVQRGKDLRKDHIFKQDEAATEAAFKGYEHAEQAPAMLSLPRIMSPPLKRTGHVTFDVCTPHGSYERWTTPKSFSKLAYRDARKARWGDLWAMGAKTRFEQRMRTGRPYDKKNSQSDVATIKAELEAGRIGSDGVVEAAGRTKRTGRDEKGWKEKAGRKSKYGNNPKTRKVDLKEKL